MKLDDVEARAQGCIALRLYPEGHQDEEYLRFLALLTRGNRVKVEFDRPLGQVHIIISC